jgi:hypothetical protein
MIREQPGDSRKERWLEVVPEQDNLALARRA